MRHTNFSDKDQTFQLLQSASSQVHSKNIVFVNVKKGRYAGYRKSRKQNSNETVGGFNNGQLVYYGKYYNLSWYIPDGKMKLSRYILLRSTSRLDEWK